jgi:hypothetical protein
LGRYFRDQTDQGHVGIIYDGRVLQSIPELGVNHEYTIDESNAMDNTKENYYEYAIVPLVV